MEVTSAPFLTTLLVSVDYADNDTGVNYTTAHDNNNNSSYNASQMTNATAEMPHIPTYLSIYVTVFNVILLMTGVVGNVLVIVVVTTVRDMRTPMNWYLVNLSMADLMVLLVCQPAALTEFFARDRWFLGQVLCKAVPFLEHATWHASTLIILAITVERYYAICKPLKKLAMCHRPRPLRVLPVVWSAATLTSVPFIIMTSQMEAVFFDGSPCYVCATKVNERWHYIYITVMTVSFFALPMLFLSGLYACIISKLRSSGTALRTRQMDDATALSTHRSRKQVVKMLVGIVLLYFISLTPLRVVILWQIYSPDDQVHGLGPEGYYNLMWMCRLLMYTNSAGNPIIYSLVSSKFQLAFTRLLHGKRGEPLIPPSTPGSRHSSISRFSITGTHRHSVATRTSSAGLREASLDNSPRNGMRKVSTPVLTRQRTSSSLSLSHWIALKGRTRSCSSNNSAIPVTKRQSSCNSLL